MLISRILDLIIRNCNLPYSCHNYLTCHSPFLALIIRHEKLTDNYLHYTGSYIAIIIRHVNFYILVLIIRHANLHILTLIIRDANLPYSSLNYPECKSPIFLP